MVVVCVLFLRFLEEPWYRLAGRAGITVLIQMIVINVGLAAFNLIPIPPLDGSRVLEAFLPFRFLRYYYWLERYGMIILLVLLMTGIVDVLFNPIFNFLWGLLPFGFP